MLRWTDPLAAGFGSRAVWIRACTNAYPAGLDQGVEVFKGISPSASFEHADLVPRATYHYTFWNSNDGETFFQPGAVYEVGPGKAHAGIGDVPWESLQPGDTVRIHYRPAPYAEKWVICRQGEPDRWITIQGVPDSQGRLPVIDGKNATTRPHLNYWSEERGVVKIGGANSPADTLPRHILVENLEIRGGCAPNVFTGRHGQSAYFANAAAIYVEKGEHVVIRNCTLRDNGNGLFVASGSSNVVVEHCRIYGNGVVGSMLEHNSYTEARGITFQFNHYGPLRAGSLGSNLKDRSGGCVVRYNWIESGNRQLDLVDSANPAIYEWEDYRTTFVYGNVLVEPDGAGNRQICHYGGDGSDPARYRKGTLHFYHNTVVSTRTDRNTLLRLTTQDETADVRNNVVYSTLPGNQLEIINHSGIVHLRNNWIPSGWVRAFDAGAPGVVNDHGGNLAGAAPGFANAGAGLYELVSTSPCIGAGTSLHPDALPAHAVAEQYLPHARRRARTATTPPDLGAFGFSP